LRPRYSSVVHLCGIEEGEENGSLDNGALIHINVNLRNHPASSFAEDRDAAAGIKSPLGERSGL
jgi:hypothetical protein